MASKTKKKATKKAASTKASKKAGKKGGPGGGEAHTPIIITDGSAAFEFDENEFPATSATTHESKGLRLIRIVANRVHGSTGSTICHELATNERVRIKVTCDIDGSTSGNDFNASGGNFMDGSGSPSFDFDHNIYNEPFPPIEKGKRVGNKKATLKRMEIFRGSTRIHDCEVITAKGLRIRLRDRHLPHN